MLPYTFTTEDFGRERHEERLREAAQWSLARLASGKLNSGREPQEVSEPAVDVSTAPGAQEGCPVPLRS